MSNVTIGAVSAFTGLTALGAGFGCKVEALMEEALHRDVGSGFVVMGATIGAVMGTATAIGIMGFFYNPLPIVYRNLTTSRYRVLERYYGGTDQFWVVHAIDNTDGKEVVLKLPALAKSKVRSGEINNAYVAKEHHILSQMDSPHIVKPVACYKGLGYFILVLEHIAGPTLYDQLQQNGPLSFAQALDMALAIAKALKEIHSKGFRHGAVEVSQNIILHPERKAVLIDVHAAHESKDPQDEMEDWLQIVRLAIGYYKADETRALIEALKERGEDDASTLAKAERLQIILDRAVKKGTYGYESYDALIRDLETLSSQKFITGHL